jgi:hypothetical protein
VQIYLNEETIKNHIQMEPGKGKKREIKTFLGKRGQILPNQTSFTYEKGKNIKIYIAIAIALILVISIYTTIFRNIEGKIKDKEIENSINFDCNSANSNEKDWCLLEKTKLTNKNFCDEIKDESISIYCYAYAKNDYNFCSRIPNKLFVDGCYIGLAIKNNNPVLCEFTTKKTFCEKEVLDSNKEN